MDWIVGKIDWILIVSGVMTFSMVLMLLAPRFMSRRIFGEETQGRLSDLVLRSWGGMVAASGLLLIYASCHPEARLPILLYAIVGKAVFVFLILSKGYRGGNAMLTVLADTVMVVLFALYLLAV